MVIKYLCFNAKVAGLTSEMMTRVFYKVVFTQATIRLIMLLMAMRSILKDRKILIEICFQNILALLSRLAFKLSNGTFSQSQFVPYL
jgi:hypothetical protein